MTTHHVAPLLVRMTEFVVCRIPAPRVLNALVVLAIPGLIAKLTLICAAKVRLELKLYWCMLESYERQM